LEGPIIESVLVTGSTGFIGTHLINELSNRNVNLTITGRKNIDKPNYLKADITNRDEVKKIVKNVDCVIHLAAASLSESQQDPEKGVKVNVNGSLNILEECISNDVKRIIFLSSATVIGESKLTKVNEDQICNPKDIYSASKLAVEGYLRSYYEEYGLKYTIFRLFNAYGPRNDFERGGLIPIVMTKIYNEDEITLHGDGGNGRDFIYVDDVAKIIADSIKLKKETDIVNLGTGDLTRLIDAINMIGEVIGKKPLIRYEPVSKPDTRSYCADIKKLNQYLGYLPSVDFHEGIKRTFNWFINR